MNHCRVIAPAKLVTDRWKRILGVFAAQIHGDLARQGDVLSSSFRFEITNLDVEVITYGFLYIFDGNLSLGALQSVAQQFFRKIDSDDCFGQRGKRS